MPPLIYMTVGKPTHADHTSAQVNSHARHGQECFGSLWKTLEIQSKTLQKHIIKFSCLPSSIGLAESKSF